MNKIITIGREFGSGGRELGKRLAEQLGIAYYDKEILSEIAKRTSLAESYVNEISNRKPGIYVPITTAHSFHTIGSDYMTRQFASVYSEQANVLREMAEKSDCVIVGRCADYILKDHRPFRLFIYANEESKFARCRDRADEHEDLSDKELLRLIRSVNKNRAKYYAYCTGHKWGERTNYDMCINTSFVKVRDVSDTLAQLLKWK